MGHFPGDYDKQGRLVRDRKRNSYKYSPDRDLLLEVTLDSGLVITYLYDSRGRLVGRRDSSGTWVDQYFYGDPSRPHLVTHAFRPKEGALTTLVYDGDDRLIFVQAGSTASYYVVTDRMGSPVQFYTDMGLLVRQVTRIPYGEVTQDTSPHLGVPIGFGGAIYDPDAQLLHFQVKTDLPFL